MRSRSVFRAMILVALLPMATEHAVAQVDGPDYWDVVGLRSHQVLRMHAEANKRSRITADVPHNARQLKNLGCRGTPAFKQPSADTEKVRRGRSNWCRVEYRGKQGWAPAIFLVPSGPSAKSK
jgi:hypothetical protein